MGKITEITVWTRGVVMDKEARDVANAFAQAAKMEGKFVQAFDNYEDLPDRVLVIALWADRAGTFILRLRADRLNLARKNKTLFSDGGIQFSEIRLTPAR